MIEKVTIEEYAIAEIKVNKFITEGIIISIDNAIYVLEKDDKELHINTINDLKEFKKYV